jgi:hypothetical protein
MPMRQVLPIEISLRAAWNPAAISRHPVVAQIGFEP